MSRSRPARPTPAWKRALPCLGAFALSLPAAFATDPPNLRPDAIAEDLETAAPDWTGAIAAGGLALELDGVTLRLSDGVLIPLRTPSGEAPLEWLFLGRGSLGGVPRGLVDRGELFQYTGSGRIDASVREAVLLPGGRWSGAGPAGRTLAVLDPPTRAAAERMTREWIVEARRDGFGARTALLLARLGDPLGQRYAAAWMETPELGRVYYALDPAAKEPASFGAYRLYLLRDFLTARERRREAQLERLRAERRAASDERLDRPAPRAACGQRDELLPPGLDEDQLRFVAGGGTLPWVRPWVGAAAADPEAEPPGFEPEHYTIELSLGGAQLEASGTTRIRYRSNADGLRAAVLQLASGMDVCEITDEDGRSLQFHENDEAVIVALAEPTRAGAAMELVLRIAGRPVVHWLGRRALRDTIAWHPHLGRIDHATYDVTLRWPESLTLLASGTPTDGGSAAGERWSRRVLDVPSIGFSFEIDDYDVVEERVGHLDVIVGFRRNDREMTEARRGQIVTVVKAVLLYFESQLGPLPIDRITVAITDRSFSQGLLGFLTLTERALHARPLALFDNRSGEEVRLETIAHEVAHQWWGHAVGWESYRDQWLSESLATFSANRFMTTIAEQPDEYLRRTAQRRLTELGRSTPGGQPVASAGSVRQGWRLRANFGPAIHHAILYDKGAAIFNTLAYRLGTEPTWRMLGALAAAVGHRTIRTETFFRGLERMAGVDLDPFLEQYVDGSGIPFLVCEYSVREAGDAWAVEGTVHQLPPARYRQVIVATERGWDVVRRPDELPDVERFTLTLPFVVDTSAESRPSGFRADLTARGVRSEFSVPSAQRPRRLWLDPQGAVLAETHAAPAGTWEVAYRLGSQRLRLGEHDAAAAELERALASALGVEAEEPEVLVRLALARLHLDRNAADTARTHLRAVEKLLPADSEMLAGERTLLAARLDVQAGQHDRAADTIRRFLARYAIEVGSVNADALLDAEPHSALRFSRSEMLALLAIAARGQGASDASLLLRMADVAGVDVRAFQVR